MRDRPFTQRYDGNSGVLHLGGTIDDQCLPDLRACLEKAAAEPVDGSVTVDLSDIDFLPSLGVGELAQARQRLADLGIILVLQTLDGSAAAAVLKVTGVDYERLPVQRYSEPPSSRATES